HTYLLSLSLHDALPICLGYLMIFKSGDYAVRAQNLHERERAIKAPRGRIFDRNGVEIATNKPVCTISVIHNQITDPERVIAVLSDRKSTRLNSSHVKIS